MANTRKNNFEKIASEKRIKSTKDAKNANDSGNDSNHNCGSECECGHEHNKPSGAETANLQQNMQQKYIEYQMLEAQSKQFQGELQKINEQLFELEYTKLSLDEYDKVKPGAHMLAPLSSGIFVKSKIADNKNFYVNVGSNIVVKKNLAEAKELLDKQLNELKSAQDKMILSFQKINLKLESIERELINLTQG